MRRPKLAGIASLILAAWPLQAQTATAPELLAGQSQIEQGDLEGALATLDGLVRRLSASGTRSRDLAEAHLYLGVAYALLDQDKAARASFREALTREPSLKLSADRYPAKVQRAFAAARETSRTPAPPAGAPPTSGARPQGVSAELLDPGGAGLPGLGIHVRPVTERILRERQLPDLGGGLLVKHVYEGTSAAAAGLQAGDIVRKVSEKIVREAPEIRELIGERRVGDEVALEVWRGARTLEMRVRLVNQLLVVRRACEGGRATGCTDLGDLYQGGLGVTADPARAAALFRQACEAGDALGCTNWAVMLATGRGMARDEARATALYKQACDQGEPYACLNLGWQHESGRGMPKDEARAAALYRQACEDGAWPACANFAWMEVWERGVPKNDAHAVAWFTLACDRRDMVACTRLGSLYETGRGVLQDPGRAVSLHRQSCEGGEMLGCVNLGISCENGLGDGGRHGPGRGLLPEGLRRRLPSGLRVSRPPAQPGAGRRRKTRRRRALSTRAPATAVRWSAACASAGNINRAKGSRGTTSERRPSSGRRATGT